MRYQCKECGYDATDQKLDEDPGLLAGDVVRPYDVHPHPDAPQSLWHIRVGDLAHYELWGTHWRPCGAMRWSKSDPTETVHEQSYAE